MNNCVILSNYSCLCFVEVGRHSLRGCSFCRMSLFLLLFFSGCFFGEGGEGVVSYCTSSFCFLSFLPHGVMEIEALNLKGASDNVDHRTILKNLMETNCGARTCNHIWSFLASRTATARIGDLRTGTTSTLEKGPPQGAVLPPAYLAWPR